MSVAPAETEESAEPTAVKPASRRKLILVVAPVLVVLVVAGGLWFGGLLPHSNRNKALTEKLDKPALVDVPDIITNLDNGSRRAMFVRLKAKIEVAHTADEAIITADMPRILDMFQIYLRSMRPEELHGGEGTYRLREALMNRIDVIAAPVQVLDVLFLEVLVQ